MAVLGATGSIGSSTLNVIGRHPERFRVAVLTAGRRASCPGSTGHTLESGLRGSGGRVELASRAVAGGLAVRERGGEGWRRRTRRSPIVVNALVGFAGLESTLAALGAGKRLALANKESLVVGGELVLDAAAPAAAICSRWTASTARSSSAWVAGPRRKCTG